MQTTINKQDFKKIITKINAEAFPASRPMFELILAPSLEDVRRVITFPDFTKFVTHSVTSIENARAAQSIQRYRDVNKRAVKQLTIGECTTVSCVTSEKSKKVLNKRKNINKKIAEKIWQE